MAYQLGFSQVAEYDPAESGINVKASLRLDQEPLDCSVKIDTGSTNCIFTRQIGERLGLKIEDGLPKWIGTATGRFLPVRQTSVLPPAGHTKTKEAVWKLSFPGGLFLKRF